MAGQDVTDEEILANTCESCMPGHFKVAGFCFRCPSGCSECSADEDLLWTETVVPFWEQVIADLESELSNTDYSSLDFSTFTDAEKNTWTIGYFLFQFIEQQSGSTPDINVIAANLQAFLQLSNEEDHDENWENFADFVNGAATLDLDDNDIEDYVIEQSEALATCSACR